MKRLSALFTLLVLTAVILSACAGSDTNGGAPETPGVGETAVVPETGDDLVATPTLGVVDEASPVVEATATLPAEVVEATPTLEATVVETTPTVEGTADVTGTPGADGVVIGEGLCVPNRLSRMFDFEVRDQNGNELGEVDALVILRDASVAIQSPDMAETPAAGETPAETTEPAMPVDLATPQLAYVLVDIDRAAELGDKDVLVPYTAFEGLTPETRFEDCAFLLSTDSAVLANAPAVDDDIWDDLHEADNYAEYQAFWDEQGVTLPANQTGATLGSPVLLEDNFDDIDVENANGDDLGEIEDFVIEPQTGQLTHAIVVAGDFLGMGGRYIPVPVNWLMWTEIDDDADDMGEVVISAPDDAWENAPVIAAIDELNTTVDNWAAEFDAYWESIEAGGTTQ